RTEDSVTAADGAGGDGGGEGPGAAPRTPLQDTPRAPFRDGPIAPLSDPTMLEEMQAHVWSASSLEVWISCPVRWLVERVLRAKALGPDPEPLSRGGLAHAGLRQRLAGLRDRTGSAPPPPALLSPVRQPAAGAL